MEGTELMDKKDDAHMHVHECPIYVIISNTALNENIYIAERTVW